MKLSGLKRTKQVVLSGVLLLGMMAASTLAFAGEVPGGDCSVCPPETVTCSSCQYVLGWWKQSCTRTTYGGCFCTKSTHSYTRLCSP